MSISNEITRLQGAKAGLKTAIEGKGVTVPSSAKLDDYPDLVDSIPQGGDMSNEAKDAILALARNVAYVNQDGADLYNALLSAFYNVTSISAVYTQSGTVYDTDSLDDLKADLVVTATYSDSSTETLPASAYTLSGTLEEGTSTITVTYEGKTATFDVIVESFNYGVYNPESVVSGSYIDDTGAVQTSTQYSGYIEDYIPVVRSSYWISYLNADIYFSASKILKSQANWRVTEYDVDKNFIKQTHFSGDDYSHYSAREIVFSSTTKFIRLGWYNSNSTDVGVFDIENPETITELQMEVGDIDSTTGQNTNSSGNVRIRSTGYIQASGSISVSGCPFAVTWNDWYVYSGYCFRCYDSNHVFVGSLTDSSSGDGSRPMFDGDITSVSLPTGTAYVRLLASYRVGYNIADFKYAVNRLFTINGVRYYIVG